MRVNSAIRRRLGLSLFAAALCLTPSALFAQGCALCYTQAANSPQRFIHALRSGILVLMLPPMFLSVMFAVMAYRRRNSFHQELMAEAAAGEDAEL